MNNIAFVNFQAARTVYHNARAQYCAAQAATACAKRGSARNHAQKTAQAAQAVAAALAADYHAARIAAEATL